MKLKSIINLMFFAVFFVVLFILPISINAQTLEQPSFPGTIEGTGTHFEITDSEYLNIILDSSEEIKLRMESMPEMLTMMIESVFSSTLSTQITLSGFEPSTTYYKYQDNYHNLAEFTTDENGAYSYTQDLSEPHFVFIQPRSSTKFIKDDATGGDCASIGNWDNSTKTCTLTADVNESIQIDSDGITLDGAGYAITGGGAGYGIYLNNRENAIIKNFIVANFSTGIFLIDSNNNTLIGNSLSSNSYGISFLRSSGNVMTDNTMFNNRYNFSITSVWDSGYDNNIDTTNKVDGKPIYYVMNGVDQVYDSSTNAGTFYCISCDNVTVRNLTLTKNHIGVFFLKTQNSRVENINALDNMVGIYLVRSVNNGLDNNSLLNNGVGIILHSNSNANFLTNNSASNGNYGISIVESSNNNLTNNTILNNRSGVHFSHSDDNIVTNNTVWNNGDRMGIYFWYSNNNKIYHNNLIDNYSSQIYIRNSINLFDNGLPDGGNYWSDFDEPTEGCDDANSDGFCDTPYTFSGGQDNYPWTVQDGWVGLQNQPPTISNLNQYKFDGETLLEESAITTHDSVVFKATLTDPNGDNVKLQVELKESNQDFNEQDLLEDIFIPSNSTSTITKYGLINGIYKWRARAMDINNNTSDWQEFGVLANLDFEIKIVPLYTQVRSPYPSFQETERWFEEDYAQGSAGNYDCGSDIARCGCALTSVVMILRYYGITDAKGGDVNPKELNIWLNSQPLGYEDGSVSWLKSERYADNRVEYDEENSGDIPNNFTTLDNYLALGQPAIAYITEGRDHFLVVDDKLANNYTVKDPAWYKTEKLDEVFDDRPNYIRDYNGEFTGLRLYKRGSGTPRRFISFYLASPAELLVVDPLGRKLGKDPATGIEYDEIPNALYFSDSIDDATGVMPPTGKTVKNLYIINPLEGDYDAQVIGTGFGEYTLSMQAQNEAGEIQTQTLGGVTQQDYISQYDLSFDSSNLASTTVERVVTIADAIEDVEISYELGLITKKFVKHILIAKLKTAQRMEQKKERMLEHFDDLIEKAKHPKVKHRLEKAKERHERTMNRTITRILNNFIRKVRFFHQKGFINDQANELLIDDARYIIEHL